MGEVQQNLSYNQMAFFWCIFRWCHVQDFLRITNLSGHKRVCAGSGVREIKEQEVVILLFQGCLMFVHMLIF